MGDRAGSQTPAVWELCSQLRAVFHVAQTLHQSGGGVTKCNSMKIPSHVLLNLFTSVVEQILEEQNSERGLRTPCVVSRPLVDSPTPLFHCMTLLPLL